VRERKRAGAFDAPLGGSSPRWQRLAFGAAALIVLVALPLLVVLYRDGDLPSIEEPTVVGSALLTASQGNVERWSSSGGTWVAAHEGDSVLEGDRVRTGVDGQALLTFEDGTTSELSEETEMVLAQVPLTAEGDASPADPIRLDLVRGQAAYQVQTTEGTRLLHVHTPAFAIDADDAAFTASVAADGTASVVVASGSATVNTKGDIRTVIPGLIVAAEHRELPEQAKGDENAGGAGKPEHPLTPRGPKDRSEDHPGQGQGLDPDKTTGPPDHAGRPDDVGPPDDKEMPNDKEFPPSTRPDKDK
jgi:hypothetical protein